MSKKTLFIGAIASIIAINSVLADTVVTSRNYVDTQDALKQDKITAGTTGNVVTYNGTQNGQAQFSERGIFNYETSGTVNEYGEYNLAQGHENDLIDAQEYVILMNSYEEFATGVNDNIIDAINNLPETTTTNKVCTEWVAGQSHTDANCLLWNLTTKTVYGRCYSDADCNGGICDTDSGRCTILQ